MLCLALCTDEQELARLALAYKECFMDTLAEGRFPLSILRHIFEALVEENPDQLNRFHEVAKLIGLPVMVYAHPKTEHPVIDIEMTIEETPEPRGNYWYDLMANRSEHNRYVFPRALHDIVLEGKRYYIGWINLHGAKDYGLSPWYDSALIYLYPADAVDANS
jgi:hypothetical protein